MKKKIINSMDRPLYMTDWVRLMLKSHPPQLLFQGQNARDYHRWRLAFEAKYHEILGPFPPAVPLRPKRLWRRVFPDFILEKVVFDSEPAMSVPAWVCLPRTVRRGQRYPAMVCCHGHGESGARGIMGLDPDGRPIPSAVYRELGIRLARQGYVTIAPNWRVFGERADPPERLPVCTCDTAHFAAEYFGYQLLTLNIWDAMKTVDYLVSRPEVDPARIGCVGLSFGGTMSLHLAARDSRIRAACVSGYFGTSGQHLCAMCGSQTLPGLLKWGDRAEVTGLICPRPLLIQTGEYDSSFPTSDCLREFKRLEQIYQAAGVRPKLGVDMFEGVHEINYPPILEWFNRWLKPQS